MCFAFFEVTPRIVSTKIKVSTTNDAGGTIQCKPVIADTSYVKQTEIEGNLYTIYERGTSAAAWSEADVADWTHTGTLNYSGTDGAYALNLEKQGDGRTWQSATTAFLLPPSSSPASITVRITTATGTRSYTYQTSDELEEGYKINIEGTYTEAVGVTLSGTIEGAEWKGERTIRFDFDESGSSAASGTAGGNSDDSNPSTAGDESFPQAGDTYQNCYVLASQIADDGESAELTLLSPNERSSVGNTMMAIDVLQDLAAGAGIDGFSDWRAMTRGEVSLLQAAHADLGIEDNACYLFDDSGTVKQMRMLNANVSNPNNNAAYIRPVVTISISKE